MPGSITKLLKAVLPADYPDLPSRPSMAVYPELPMNWTVQEAYGKVRQYDPNLTKNIKSVKFGRTIPNAAMVIKSDPATVIVNDTYQPNALLETDMNYLRWLTSRRPEYQFEPKGLAEILAHEGQHVKDLHDPSQRFMPNERLEARGYETSDKMRNWIYGR